MPFDFALNAAMKDKRATSCSGRAEITSDDDITRPAPPLEGKLRSH